MLNISIFNIWDKATHVRVLYTHNMYVHAQYLWLIETETESTRAF